MMLFALLATQEALPPAPRPLPPFTRYIEAVARHKGARVSAAYKVCGDARTNANGRWVDAMGTPRHSTAWNIARLAVKSSLSICQEQRQALRDQAEFFEDVAMNGSKYNSELAVRTIDGVTSELEGIERYYATETPRYHHLLTVGWGSPHCIEHADDYAPRFSICAAGENPFQP